MQAQVIPQLTLPCQVVSVYDGDTLAVDVTFRMNVRLLDCWAPEITGEERPQGLKSKERLTQLALGKKGTLTVPFGGNDLGDSFTFGRTLARLVIDGQDVSQQMVLDGFATLTKQK